MFSQFFRLVELINNDELTIKEAASSIVELMTDCEHLSLLQGERLYTQHLSDNRATPYPASTVRRLGVPGLHITDGSREAFFTEYPSPLGRAASFNTRLEEVIGEAIGTEIRAHGGNLYSGICLNVTRRSTWGRAHESYGEDPHLISRMGSAAAKGARKHVLVGVRYFALNSTEKLREDHQIVCDEATMNEVFLQHFRDVLFESGAEAVFSAGNIVNGVPCAENPALLNGILRQRWQLDDIIVGNDMTWPLQNGPGSIKAGLDVELPFQKHRTSAVEQALELGKLSWSDIQIMTKRIIAAQLRYYCRAVRMQTPIAEHIRCKEHVALARRSVAESMVLLQNDKDFLPLSGTSKLRLTVLGALADRVGTARPFDVSSHVQGPSGTTPLEALQRRHNLEVDYERDDESRAARLALAADAVLIFIRPSREAEPHEVPKASRLRRLFCLPSRCEVGTKESRNTSKFRDSSLNLNDADLKLARKVLTVAAHKTVVVIEAGSSVLIPRFVRQNAVAIIFSSYSCRQYGNGLKDVLFGEQEPSGRLPFVLPGSEQQLVEHKGKGTSFEINYDGIWGYRRLQHERQRPAYPFGFGLGYSAFTLETFWCSSITQNVFEIAVKAVNTSKYSGAVVVQVYASKAQQSDSMPPESIDHNNKCLIGFAKEVVASGQSDKVFVTCRLSPLAKYNMSTTQMVVAAGDYEIDVCQFESDERAISSNFRITQHILC